ncbi:hypothetical protein JMUB6875_53440 [Nocardia sp. JMUB6875]
MVDPSSETAFPARVAVLVMGSGGAPEAVPAGTTIENVVTTEHPAAASIAARVPNPPSKTDLRSTGCPDPDG